MEQYIELFASEIEIEVAYVVEGKNIPASGFDPAEYAEVELRHVKLFGNDLLPELSPADQAIIIDECEANHVEQEQSEKEAEAEAKLEAQRDMRLAA